MVFSSFTFLLFFFIVYLLLLIFKKSHKIEKIILLSSSYFFYGYWDYRFLSLIFFSTIVDYYIGRKIFQTKNIFSKKKLLFTSMFANLGLLFFFKYFNFFIDSFNSSFSFSGIEFETLNIILPVGISFYTFQTMSYTLDIYRGKLKPANSLMDFSIFVAFFPQLVAGPIVRAIDFIPQLEKKIELNKTNLNLGFQIFLNGFFKKLFIADTLSVYVDHVFANPSVFDSLTIWFGVIAYAVQIFCDFSGYSDMAIGIAKIFGFNLPENFRAPYLAKNITEFWHRWHISLSTWLKDYLYISLGGNRKGKIRTYINLMLTMVLGGLWHGASWNFVIWGTLHGLGLVVHKLLLSKLLGLNNLFFSVISWIFNMIFILICWVFFRAENTDFAMIMIRKMFTISEGASFLYTKFLIFFPFIILTHIFAKYGYDRKYYTVDLTSLRGIFVIVTIIFIFILFSPLDTSPFIYFQF
ncbi:MAG: MBOAT family protein [Candidatus Delongbacteria bacterium]|nr:MBOAT family protein [Candidatus Delongbacteria bacterium]MBN2835801.1 MBOAT family protein [Candidatus Delongbacteria bacterium]